LFFTFLKIGAFTIGGAYAMIPLIKQEVCKKRSWISEDEFLDGLAAAQSCPGPIAVNLSIYIGYHIRKGKGMAVAVLGTVLPSFISIILIAMLFTRFAEQPGSQSFSCLASSSGGVDRGSSVSDEPYSRPEASNFWFPLGIAVLVAFECKPPST
jgi:chromate transporter